MNWLSRRHDRVLDNAYTAAQEIRSLEKQYCGGKAITDERQLGRTVYDYARSLCDRKLLTIRNNLTQFRINSFLLGANPATKAAEKLPIEATRADSAILTKSQLVPDEVINKLNFIESVISRYRDSDAPTPTIDLSRQPQVPTKAARLTRSSRQTSPESSLAIDSPEAELAAERLANPNANPAVLEVEVAAKELARPGLLGSFTLNRKQTKEYEQQVVQELRQRNKQSRIALRWAAILIILPIAAAFLAKTFIFGPVLGNYSDKNPTAVQLGAEVREEFTAHLTEFKEELEIRELLKLSPEITPLEKQERLAEKASELWREARTEELDGLKNLLADVVATLVFVVLVFFNRRRIAIIRAFSNRAFLSLSDPVKIFIFILVTDMFVGFHSAEGWDAILTGVSVHFGIPEHPNAIKIFIATVPVMMDSFIKFWIFNYLTRVSPASSAIFERMNS